MSVFPNKKANSKKTDQVYNNDCVKHDISFFCLTQLEKVMWCVKKWILIFFLISVYPKPKILFGFWNDVCLSVKFILLGLKQNEFDNQIFLKR